MAYPDRIEIPSVVKPVNARITLPGSKSYTNRVLPIAALANGRSTLLGILDSDDTRYMVGALETLGFDVQADWAEQTVIIEGRGGQIPATSADLFLGNSGTSMRFLTAFVALGKGSYRLDGVDRMRQRPIGPLLEALHQLGVRAESEIEVGFPPVRVIADGLQGGSVTIPGNLSSQYFSALAMVMPCAAGPIELRVDGELVSKPYIDLTASAMRAFGVELINEDYQRLSVPTGQKYQARNYQVEPDASAASYFYALAAATGGTITVAGLGAESAQGDVRFVEILEQMGCTVERGPEITLCGAPDGALRGIDIDMNDISDTLMSLAAIAPFADSPTTIRNVAHVRHKETDRIAATVTELRRMGIDVEEWDDGLRIHPGEPQPAQVHTYDDHRMAMAFAITGVRAAGIEILDPGCVSKTVPEFWDILLPLLASAPVEKL